MKTVHSNHVTKCSILSVASHVMVKVSHTICFLLLFSIACTSSVVMHFPIDLQLRENSHCPALSVEAPMLFCSQLIFSGQDFNGQYCSDFSEPKCPYK